MLSLPCPKCRKPNPVESRTCDCGHTLVQQNAEAAPVAAPFPELRSILPELKPTPKKQPANLRLVVPKDVRQENSSPDRPKLVEVSSSNIAAPIFELPESGSGSRRRRTYGLVFVGLFILTAAAAYLGGFVGLPSMLKQTAEPVQFAQSNATVDGSETVSNEEPSAATPNEQTESAADNEEVGSNEPAKKPRPAATQTGKPENRVRAADNTVATSAPAQGLAFDVLPDSDKKPVTNTAVAVAKCGDGTYTYRKSPSGTCAQRGGVAQWLDGTKSSPSAAKLPKSEADRVYLMGSRGGCYYTTAAGSKKYVDKSYCN